MSSYYRATQPWYIAATEEKKMRKNLPKKPVGKPQDGGKKEISEIEKESILHWTSSFGQSGVRFRYLPNLGVFTIG